MIAYIAMCNKKGIVERVYRSVPIGLINEGRDIRALFCDAGPLERLLAHDLDYGISLRLRMDIADKPEVFVSVKAVRNRLLVLGYDLDNTQELAQMMEMVLSVLDLPEASGKDPYGIGYYEIQKLNSQLINYQRSLAKTNVRLAGLLEETQAAKCTIEALERDPLTGLYTEKVFYDRAAALLQKYPEQGFDMVAVDIEHFKIVNDAFGTAVGDQLLKNLAVFLMSLPADGCALFTRARADIFFALLPRQASTDQMLETHISSFLERYPLPMRLKINIGVYVVEERGLAVARMCDRALLAAENVKGSFVHHIALYDHTMHEKLIREQQILNTMQESLKREDFQVYLQPKVEIGTGRLIGAEALVRWKHPDMGMISPADFIPLFEKNGFIYSLDLFVWRTVCRMLRDWGGAIPVSVNVSRTDLYHEDLPETLVQMRQEYGLAPDALHLEITESAYVKDSVQILAVIRRLKQAGFVIEMDDFGSGYSSLNTLSDLPIDVMKLDLQFLSHGENEARHHKVMRLVIDLAKELQLQVIAEGVETAEQAQLLKNMGCPLAQGYFYGRPMPEREFLKYITP